MLGTDFSGGRTESKAERLRGNRRCLFRPRVDPQAKADKMGIFSPYEGGGWFCLLKKEGLGMVSRNHNRIKVRAFAGALLAVPSSLRRRSYEEAKPCVRSQATHAVGHAPRIG